jgi:hypothetical protein
MKVMQSKFHFPGFNTGLNFDSLFDALTICLIVNQEVKTEGLIGSSER